jgi:hypothetical protein
MRDINKAIKHNAIEVAKSESVEVFGNCYFIVFAFVDDIDHFLLSVARMVENL